MAETFIKLPRILITNDDGINAEGLHILADAVKDFTNEVWIVAPGEDQSGRSESISITDPVKFRKRDDRQFTVSGTPSDCVILAAKHFMKDAPPNLIISGVNAGANFGDELCLSGTVGAALTGLILGIPSIAISQVYITRNNVPWDTSKAVLPKILKHFLTEGWRKETCLSVNIPNQPPESIGGINWARQSKKNISDFNVDIRPTPRGGEYAWISLIRATPEDENNSEYSILSRGRISVTALSLDRSVEILKSPIKFEGTESAVKKDG